jgi:hypothetical protein
MDHFTEARSLSNRLDAINKSVEDELKTSPQQIRERGAQRRLAAINKASPEARAMLVSTGKLSEDEVKKALVPDAPTPDPAQPASSATAKGR